MFANPLRCWMMYINRLAIQAQTNGGAGDALSAMTRKLCGYPRRGEKMRVAALKLLPEQRGVHTEGNSVAICAGQFDLYQMTGNQGCRRTDCHTSFSRK